MGGHEDHLDTRFLERGDISRALLLGEPGRPKPEDSPAHGLLAASRFGGEPDPERGPRIPPRQPPDEGVVAPNGEARGHHGGAGGFGGLEQTYRAAAAECMTEATPGTDAGAHN